MTERNEIITNLKVYDLFESFVSSGYAMISDYDSEGIKKEIADFL